MAKDNCALNQDGSLKDTSQIQWYFDSDEVPQPQQRKAKRAKVATFLDLEAQVGSDSENEDDKEQPDDNEDDNEDPNVPVCQLELACSVQAEQQPEIISHLYEKVQVGDYREARGEQETRAEKITQGVGLQLQLMCCAPGIPGPGFRSKGKPFGEDKRLKRQEVELKSDKRGDIGILKSVNANGHAELEVEACLISMGKLEEVSIMDLYIPGYNISNILPFNLEGATDHPSQSVCMTPVWENDSGTGSQTPAWDPSSRTPQISNVVSAEELAYPHQIPENIASTSALQASTPLPNSMRTTVIGEGSSAHDASADAFNNHWINQLLKADSSFLDHRYLHVVISGSLLTAASSGFKRG
ncbi:hypothetical protein BDQ17DRAFT_1432481 [Cyathus striatus]|nr:hypothetical protein BDQ17DRAFT_1432481 [Cyathus striatus]